MLGSAPYSKRVSTERSRPFLAASLSAVQPLLLRLSTGKDASRREPPRKSESILALCSSWEESPARTAECKRVDSSEDKMEGFAPLSQSVFTPSYSPRRVKRCRREAPSALGSRTAPPVWWTSFAMASTMLPHSSLSSLPRAPPPSRRSSILEGTIPSEPMTKSCSLPLFSSFLDKVLSK